MFLLAQVSDLLYFFFLMFLSEAIFNASKETIYGIILLFFTFKMPYIYYTTCLFDNNCYHS